MAVYLETVEGFVDPYCLETMEIGSHLLLLESSEAGSLGGALCSLLLVS